MKPGGFDTIAHLYDPLARLVFGNAIRDAQVYFLEEVPPQSKVLILGGGTGWFLDQLLTLKQDSEIWYIEASKKMLELSKNKTRYSSCVHFIHGTENNIPSEIEFDVVITNFYLDLFTDPLLDSVLEKIKARAKPNMMWLVTDFVNGNKWWQFYLLKIMYRFFRTTCEIDASRLPDWNKHLLKHGLIKAKSKSFYKGFIEAAVYNRIG